MIHIMAKEAIIRIPVVKRYGPCGSNLEGRRFKMCLWCTTSGICQD
ncbi:hypothetical protein [Candidatus Kuenenia stuttgartiensis]